MHKVATYSSSFSVREKSLTILGIGASTLDDFLSLESKLFLHSSVRAVLTSSSMGVNIISFDASLRGRPMGRFTINRDMIQIE